MNIKLQSALIDIGKAVGKLPKAPTVPEIKTRFDAFLQAVDSGDLGRQTNTGNDLAACLVKWQVENL